MLNYNVSYLSESGFSLVASFRMHHASFFRPRCLSLRGHVIVVKQKFIVDGGGASTPGRGSWPVVLF